MERLGMGITESSHKDTKAQRSDMMLYQTEMIFVA
jgi:hypothetical protein